MEQDIVVSQADDTVSRANSLREFADWLAKLEYEHPDLAKEVYLHISVGIWQPSQAPMIADWARALAPCNKYYYESCIELSRYFGQIRFEVNISRQFACTKRVVGTKVVPERYIPGRVEPERIEEIVEWDCSPLLADQRSDDIAAETPDA